MKMDLIIDSQKYSLLKDLKFTSNNHTEKQGEQKFILKNLLNNIKAYIIFSVFIFCNFIPPFSTSESEDWTKPLKSVINN
jgi:hypothetical protein